MKIDVILADYNNPKHGLELIQLLNAYAQDPMGGGTPLSSHVQQNLIAEFAKQTHVFSLICYVNGQPAGLVNCVEGFSTFACKPLVNIHDLAVLAKFRGLGISQKMLQAVEQIAIQKDCCKITLEVLEGNELAKKAYLKHGFAGYQLDPAKGRAMFWQKVLTEN
ncbi:GNAT family N-acetyltransferase [Paraglaciecola sp. L3A3]|uniref:GNAT family N-acetyltransferase n=1 Tax=Paraglaciecola sp. L3A3 TaxID=2686358 RepID=UPI00131D33CC|nr:GNAT family N-acetyltransferase [Paraglaciecola sp. L3A3]